MEATMEKVVVLPQLVESVKHHCRIEARKPAEAVGFLARRRGFIPVTTTVPLRNHAADREHGYFVEPWEQFRAETKLEEAGYEIVGVYHSHPGSEALHSAADRAMARTGELMFIYSVVFDQLRAWREVNGDLEPVELSHGV